MLLGTFSAVQGNPLFQLDDESSVTASVLPRSLAELRFDWKIASKQSHLGPSMKAQLIFNHKACLQDSTDLLGLFQL